MSTVVSVENGGGMMTSPAPFSRIAGSMQGASSAPPAKRPSIDEKAPSLQHAASAGSPTGGFADPLGSITRLLSSRNPAPPPNPPPPTTSPSRGRSQRALSSPSVPPPPADEIHSIGPLLDDKPHPPPDAAVALPPSPSAPAVPRRRSSFARIRGLDKIDHKDEALSDGEPDEDSKLREILKLRLTVSHTDPKTGRRRSLSAPSTPRTDEENAGHPPPPLATLQPEEKPQTASARGPTPSQQHRQRPLSAADMFRMREAAAGGERAAGGGIAGMTQGEGGSNAAPSARRASVRTVAANGDRYSLSMEAADGLIKVGFRTGQPPAHLICQKRANSFRGQSPRSPETGTVPQVSPAARASFSGPSPLPAGDAFALPDPSSTRSQRTLSLDSATAASIPHPDDPPPAVLPATQSLPANAI